MGDSGQTTTMAVTKHSLSDCIMACSTRYKISDTVESEAIIIRGDSAIILLNGYGIKLTSNELPID